MATIFSLSSGPAPAGIAVIRVSGAAVGFGLKTLTGSIPEARRAVVRDIRSSVGDIIDRGVVLFFPGPASFTGEDVAEYQVHGGRAIVAALLDALAQIPDSRPAEAGEFTRRAFVNGRVDLSQVEGLADLVRAETEVQRRQALRQAEGGLRRRAEEWRDRLLRARALVEAQLDFGEDEEIPVSAIRESGDIGSAMEAEIKAELLEFDRGARVREGATVVLLGPPNVGKSSLLNALARSEVAIVTPEPGTTRDLVEARLDLGGYAAVLVDTAGVRETSDPVEVEGVRRARQRAYSADIVVWMSEASGGPRPGPAVDAGTEVLAIGSKADLIDSEGERSQVAARFDLLVSARTGEGIGALLGRLREMVAGADYGGAPALVTRARQRHALAECAEALVRARYSTEAEIMAENLRQASDSLGRLTGGVDVERVLDLIFSEFCIGK